MKTLQKFNLSIALAVTLTSCVATKPYADDFANEQKKGKDSTSDLFVIKKDGQKLAVKKLSYQHKLKIFPNGQPSEDGVVADGEKIKFGEYQAIQTSGAFKILYHPENDTRFSKGLYISRLRAGKISLYHYECMSTTSHTYQKKRLCHNYVFQKENGQTVWLDYQSFAEAIKDNSMATKKLKHLFPFKTIPNNDTEQTLANLTTLVELYNQSKVDAVNAVR
jgi:hypothetical protein